MKKLLFIVLATLYFNMYSQVTVSTLTSVFKGSGGVTIDEDGNVYIADFGDSLGGADTDGVPNNVMKLDEDLNLTIFANDFTGASGNEFGSDGYLYQADIGDNAVYKIVNGSRELYASSGLILPVGIAFDSNDNLYVCNCGNNTIRKITPTGTSTLFASGNLFGCPNGMTIDENDNLYIVNFSNPFIVKIEPDGTTSNIGSISTGNGHIDYDINTNNLYIASFSGHQIYYLDLDTLESDVLAGTGAIGNNDGPGNSATFSAPNGVAVSKTGDSIYINSSATPNNNNLNPQYVRLISNVLGSLSIGEFETNSNTIKTYPNPTTDELTIESNLITDLNNLAISFWDMNGRTIEASNITYNSLESKLKIDVSTFKSGIYFYSIKLKKRKLKIGKLIKK